MAFYAPLHTLRTLHTPPTLYTLRTSTPLLSVGLRPFSLGGAAPLFSWWGCAPFLLVGLRPFFSLYLLYSLFLVIGGLRPFLYNILISLAHSLTRLT